MTDVYVGNDGKIVKIKYIISKQGEDDFECKNWLAVMQFATDCSQFSDWLYFTSQDSDRPQSEIEENIYDWLQPEDVESLLDADEYTLREVLV